MTKTIKLKDMPLESIINKLTFSYRKSFLLCGKNPSQLIFELNFCGRSWTPPATGAATKNLLSLALSSASLVCKKDLYQSEDSGELQRRRYFEPHAHLC